jgi:signal transduction histidine kinase
MAGGDSEKGRGVVTLRGLFGLQGLLVAALVVVGFAASLTVLLVVLPTLESSVSRDQAARQADALSEQVRAIAATRELEAPVSEEELLDYARAVRTATGGDVFVSSNQSFLAPAYQVQIPPDSALLSQFRIGPVPAQVTSDREAVSASAPLQIGNGLSTTNTGFVQVATPVTGLAPELAAVQRRVIVAVFVVLALAVLAGLALSRLIGKRTARLARTASQLAGGDLTARAPREGPEELRVLSDALNLMAGRVEGLVGDITHERDRAQAMIGSLEEGVIAVGPGGGVTVANDAAYQFLGVPPGAQFLRIEELPLPIAEAARAVLDLDSPSTAVREVALPGGIEADLTAVRLTGEGAGAVLALRDVTEARRLERARRDLVANVSHELKTPLAAIRGFQELLEDPGLDEAHRTEFIGLMKGEISRLERLVEEQLQLARLDAGALPMEIGSVDIGDLAAGVAEPRRILAERDGMALGVEVVPQQPVLARADASRVEQILLILLDNAQRHAGGNIRVVVSSEADTVVVDVVDDGQGIPPEDQETIFDRFYRRDASRSRPGAGLGLAIARGLAVAQNGELTLESEVGVGSTFSLRLPLDPETRGPSTGDQESDTMVLG